MSRRRQEDRNIEYDDQRSYRPDSRDGNAVPHRGSGGGSDGRPRGGSQSLHRGGKGSPERVSVRLCVSVCERSARVFYSSTHFVVHMHPCIPIHTCITHCHTHKVRLVDSPGGIGRQRLPGKPVKKGAASPGM